MKEYYFVLGDDTFTIVTNYPDKKWYTCSTWEAAGDFTGNRYIHKTIQNYWNKSTVGDHPLIVCPPLILSLFGLE